MSEMYIGQLKEQKDSYNWVAVEGEKIGPHHVRGFMSAHGIGTRGDIQWFTVMDFTELNYCFKRGTLKKIPAA